MISQTALQQPFLPTPPTRSVTFGLQTSTHWSLLNKPFSDDLTLASCLVESALNFESKYREKDYSGVEKFNLSKCRDQNNLPPTTPRLYKGKYSSAVDFDFPLTQSSYSRAIGRKPTVVECKGFQYRDLHATFECQTKGTQTQTTASADPQSSPKASTPGTTTSIAAETAGTTSPTSTTSTTAATSSTGKSSASTTPTNTTASPAGTTHSTPPTQTTATTPPSNSSDLIPPRLPSPPLRDKNSKPGGGGPRLNPWTVAGSIAGGLTTLLTIMGLLSVKKAYEQRRKSQGAQQEPAQQEERQKLKDNASVA